MKRILSVLLILICTLSVLTGCVREEIGVVLNDNGSAKLTATVGIEKDAYDQIIGMGGKVFEGEETFEYEYDGKTYVAVNEETEFENYEELRQALLDMDYSTGPLEDAQIVGEETESGDTANEAEPVGNEPADTHIFKEVTIDFHDGWISKSYAFRAVMNPQPEDSREKISIPDSIRVALSVEMPCEITEANSGKVDGRKVTFDIDDLTQENELSVIAEQTNTVVIVISVVIAVLVLVGFWLLVRGNRKMA